LLRTRGPNPTAWLTIPDLEDRARHAFRELYSWFRDHADELYPIYRDAAAMPLSAQQATMAGNQELAAGLVAGHVAAPGEAEGNGRLIGAVACHLVDFWTWRSLVVQQGLNERAAVNAAVRMLTAMVDDRPSSTLG
jgi:hypothetical protein